MHGNTAESWPVQATASMLISPGCCIQQYCETGLLDGMQHLLDEATVSLALPWRCKEASQQRVSCYMLEMWLSSALLKTKRNNRQLWLS